jgi:hypothetical protein
MILVMLMHCRCDALFPDTGSETDDSVKLWLERLQDVAYDAEDVLDEFAYEIL